MGAPTVKSDFAIHEAVVLSGFSKHMLDYLAREDIFRPRSDAGRARGRHRRYSYEDLVLLRALHTICAGKGKIRHLKASLVALREELGPIAPGQRVDRLLFVEGDELCLRTGKDGGRQLRTGQMTLAFVVDLRVVSLFVADAVKTDRQSGLVSLKPEVAQKAEAERQRTWSAIRERREACR
jgi:DNA-binding transcriptional MerR regulator